MTVTYPDGEGGTLTLTEEQHAALVAMDRHAQSGELSDEGLQMAKRFDAANKADAEASAEQAAPKEDISGTPDSSWTVAQLDSYANQRAVPDYPSTGTKADKLAAIEAAG